MSDSPYLTRAEAAAYVRATVDAFDWWVKSRGVPCVRRGRIRLFKRDVLDRVLAHDAVTRKFRKAS
jgi:excisionase family DNA binding protein